MIRHQVSLSLSALGLLGCADLLGLGGLSYDQGVSDIEATGGQANAGDGDGHTNVNSSGDGGISGTHDEYPKDFERAAVFASGADDGGPARFWVYEPESDNLSFFVFNSDGEDYVGTQGWAPEDTFTHLVSVPIDGADTLLGYNSASGLVSQVSSATGAGDLERLSDDVGTSGRTHFLHLPVENDWLAFVYSSQTGDYRYFLPFPAEDAGLFSGIMEPGWTSVVRFGSQADAGVLKHNSQTGELAFDRFVSRGEPLENVWFGQANEEATMVRGFVNGVSGEWEVLFYQRGEGKVSTMRVVPLSTGVSLELKERGYFRGDLTEIVTLNTSSGPRALTFSADSGQAAMRDLSPLDRAGGNAVR